MNQILMPDLGGFRLQYTDTTKEILEGLEEKLRDRLHDHLLALAEKNPYAGDTVPLGNKDRRLSEFEDLTVTFWVAADLKVMTIVVITSPEEE
jgi:hypothetical protein